MHAWVLDDSAQLQNLGGSLFEAVASEVRTARFKLGAVADKLVLIACELATYALNNSFPPTMIRLYRCDPDLLVDIAYSDTTSESADRGSQPPGGLGLRLAQRAALTVGWYVHDNTKHVWAQFPTEGDRGT